MSDAVPGVDLTALEASLKSLMPPGGRPLAPMGITADGVEKEFCTVWPKVEPILKIVGQYIGFIPGVGSAAGVAVNSLVAAGDGLSGVVCPKPAATAS